MAGRLASLLILIGLAGPGASAAQAATLDLSPAGTTVTELAPVDGVLGAGDQFRLVVSATSHEAAPLTELQGELTSQSAFASVLSHASPFTAVSPRGTTSNSTAFRVALTNSPAWCGQPVHLNLRVARGSIVPTFAPRAGTIDYVDLPFTVRTGLPAAFVNRDASLGSGLTLAAGATTSSTLTVPASAERVRDVRVRIGDLQHARLADLHLTLVSPSGTRVSLVEGKPGSELRNTVLAAGGTSLASAGAPLTGTYAPQGDLSTLDGELAAGDWQLEVQDTGTGSTGTLAAWGLDLAPATCAARPVAAFLASPSPVAVGGTATLDASSSRIPNGQISTYEWDFGDGAGWVSSPGSTKTHVFGARGAVDVRLRITGTQGETDTVTQKVAVGQAPVAALTAAPPTVKTGEDTVLNAAGSTSPGGGSIARYEWDLDDNGTFEVDGGSDPQQLVNFADIATHNVVVRVTNDIGARATAQVTIDVTNRKPVASLAVPSPVLAGVAVDVDASASTDPDDGIARYRYDLDEDGIFELDGTTPIVQHTFTGGPHTIKVTVTDVSGASSTAAVTFNATAPPDAALVVTPGSLRPGQVATVEASGSTDADGAIARYDFDLDANGTYETPAAPGATSVTRSWPTRGVKTVGVRVTDADNATGTATATVSVVNASPLPVLSAGSGAAQVGQPVLLDAAGSSDPDGSVVLYEWDLDGNGTFELSTGASPTAARAYANALSLRVGVRVTDNDGQTASATTALVIVPAPVVLPGPSGPTGGGGVLGGGGGGGVPGGGSGGSGGGSGGSGGTGGGTAGTGGGGGGGGGVAAGSTFAAALQAAAVQKLKDVTKKGLAFTCQADRSAACVIAVTLEPADAKRVGLMKGVKGRAAKQPVVLATLRASAAPGRDGKLVLKLSSKLKEAFGRQRSVLVVLTGTATDAAGHAVAVSRAVMLKR